jgi:hypothetical protein
MMVPKEWIQHAIDPVELINQVIEDAWEEISSNYDVSGCAPDLQDLFRGVDLADPRRAAEALVVSMLQEVGERVGRFSPWYKRPARAYGLTSMRDKRTNRVHWVLAPEAVLQQKNVIETLETMITKYSGLIQALVLVANLTEDFPGDPCVTAQCACYPPLRVQLRRSVLEKAQIVCEQCQQPFTER